VHVSARLRPTHPTVNLREGSQAGCKQAEDCPSRADAHEKRADFYPEVLSKGVDRLTDGRLAVSPRVGTQRAASLSEPIRKSDTLPGPISPRPWSPAEFRDMAHLRTCSIPWRGCLQSLPCPSELSSVC